MSERQQEGPTLAEADGGMAVARLLGVREILHSVAAADPGPSRTANAYVRRLVRQQEQVRAALGMLDKALAELGVESIEGAGRG